MNERIRAARAECLGLSVQERLAHAVHGDASELRADRREESGDLHVSALADRMQRESAILARAPRDERSGLPWHAFILSVADPAVCATGQAKQVDRRYFSVNPAPKMFWFSPPALAQVFGELGVARHCRTSNPSGTRSQWLQAVRVISLLFTMPQVTATLLATKQLTDKPDLDGVRASDGRCN